MAAAAPAAADLHGLDAAAEIPTSQAYLESKQVMDARALISDLCRQFYTLGWVSGTGGSITIKVHDDSIPKPDQLIVMSPSGTLLSQFKQSNLFSHCARNCLVFLFL